jgi:hypothetical protein
VATDIEELAPAGLGLKDAAAPPGIPTALNVTMPANPALGVMVIV